MKTKTNLLLEKRWVNKLVALGKMHTRTRHAQREIRNENRVGHLVHHFDLDKFEPPTLSERKGTYYIIDGDHRVAAVSQWLGEGWESQQIECRVYSGLTEAEEAELFLSLNDKLTVSAMDKFRVSVNAGREDEMRVQALVEKQGLCISRERIPNSIGSVTTLMRVYRRSNGDILSKALRIIRDAYGDPGFEQTVIDGLAHVCQRYNGTIEEKQAIDTLASAKGGVNGLLGRAEVLRKQTGNSKSQCVAAAAVDIIKTAKGGRHIPSWWKSGDASPPDARTTITPAASSRGNSHEHPSARA